MDVKCPICDEVSQIDDDSPLAKCLRNRRKHLYLCPTCDERIGKKTRKRQATGKFHLYEEKKEVDPYIQ
ncbi:YlaI family protein [Amphibacillus sp. MSJ-3]|uniref:YlaI family protein n=1 Tax=Amphibacillus sp. MSJ-3 TaxID=2841505 RepID=UPI001C0ECBE4|nr:YlaI family protein [Amphibacillus sp. MSJ-3]MBU5595566.1 YlaI family protein [Amphibacillus sp. MSJ-3]